MKKPLLNRKLSNYKPHNHELNNITEHYNDSLVSTNYQTMRETMRETAYGLPTALGTHSSHFYYVKNSPKNDIANRNLTPRGENGMMRTHAYYGGTSGNFGGYHLCLNSSFFPNQDTLTFHMSLPMFSVDSL